MKRILILTMLLFSCAKENKEESKKLSQNELLKINYDKCSVKTNLEPEFFCGHKVYRLEKGFLVPSYLIAKHNRVGVKTVIENDCELITEGDFLIGELSIGASCMYSIYDGIIQEVVIPGQDFPIDL